MDISCNEVHITFILMYCQLIVHNFYSYVYIPHKFEQTYVEVFTSVHSYHVMKEVHWDPLMSMAE